eukprot:COSAG03_NODE_3412_length_2032_cov_40.608898_4_plen_136_part_00
MSVPSVPNETSVYPKPPPSRDTDRSDAGLPLAFPDGRSSECSMSPPPSRQTLPDSVIDKMFASASELNPALGTFAELPDQALLNVLRTLDECSSDNIKEAVERQLATRERLKFLLTPRGARFQTYGITFTLTLTY